MDEDDIDIPHQNPQLAQINEASPGYEETNYNPTNNSGLKQVPPMRGFDLGAPSFPEEIEELDNSRDRASFLSSP